MMKKYEKKYDLKEQDNKEELQKKIVDFFSDNPKPSDGDIHSFAEKEGIDAHKFEEIVYELLGSFLGSGKSKGKDIKIDPNELKMGLEVEKEHVDNPILAKKIVSDHIADRDDYYSFGKKVGMFDELK